MKLLQRITILTIVLFILVTLAFGALTIRDRFFLDRTPPVLTCSSDILEISVNDPDSALLQGVSARDDTDGDLTSQILVKSVSPLITSDTAKVSYIVFDASNNMATVSRTVRYVDYQKPSFSLLRPLVFQIGETVTLKDRLVANDVIDGNISSNIRVISQNISTQYEGTYGITVQVTNSMGDAATLPLKVVISSQATPQLIFLTDYIVYLETGTTFRPEDYIESVRNSDFTAANSNDIEIESAVDPQTPGVYDVLYTYTSGSQTYKAYLTVVVEEA